MVSKANGRTDLRKITNDNFSSIVKQLIQKIVNDDLDDGDSEVSTLLNMCVEYTDDATSDERRFELIVAITALVSTL